MINYRLLISFAATIVQFYDYAIFGLAAGFLAQEFMPNNIAINSIIGVFGVFSVSVIARPIGSLIFGVIGDSYGRVLAIRIATIFSAISVIIIGITPAWDRIGNYATIIFVFSRIVFIMSLAGESDGIRVYIFEAVGEKYKHLANSIVSSCYQFGVMIAALIFWLTNKLSISFFGWRICFVIGGIAGIIIFHLRQYLTETSFSTALNPEVKNSNLYYYKKMISSYWRLLFIGIIFHGCIGGIYNFQVIFLSTYITKILCITSMSSIYLINMTGLGLYILIAPFAGYLSDQYNSNKQIKLALISGIILSIANTFLINKGIFLPLIQILIILLMPFYAVPIQVKLNAIIPKEVRLRIFSLSHSIGSMVISSQINLLASLIWSYSHLVFLTMVISTILYSCLIIGYTKINFTMNKK